MCNNTIIKTSNKDEMTYTYSTKYSEFRREVSQSANMNPRAWQTSCAENQFKLQTVPFILIWLCLPRRVTNRNPSSSVSVSVPFTSLTSDTLSRSQVGSEEYIHKDIADYDKNSMSNKKQTTNKQILQRNCKIIVRTCHVPTHSIRKLELS